MSTDTPGGWVKAALGDLGRWVGGGTPSKSNPRFWTPDGIPWVSPKDMKTRRVVDSEDHITEDAVTASATNLVPAGSVLIVIRSGILQRTLPVAVTGRPVAINQDLKALIPGEGVEPEYVAALLRARSADILATCTKQGTTVASVRFPSLKAYQVPIAPLNEQRRIVAKIEALGEGVKRARSALEAIPPLLERFRQSVLAAAFRGDLTVYWRARNPDTEPASVLLDRIRTRRRQRWEDVEIAKRKEKGRPSKDSSWRDKYADAPLRYVSELAQLPESWEWSSLAGLTDPVRVIRYGILMPGPDQPGGVRYIKVLHMKGDRIAASDLPRTSPEIHSKYAAASLAKGDLLLSIRGTYGRVAKVPDSVAGANITQDSARIAPLPGVNRDYLAAVLRSPQVQNYLKSVAKGVAVRGVNIRDIRPMPIPLPPEQEQVEIARLADAVEASVWEWSQLTARSILDCQALESSVLNRAFEGRLVPQDPRDEAVAALITRIRGSRELDAETPKTQPKKGGARMMSRTVASRSAATRMPLYDCLRTAKGGLTPEELLARAGFDDDSIDQFYEELRREVEATRISERRPDSSTVLLEAASE